MYEFLDYVVSDAMTREPVCVAPGASLASVEQLLEQHGWNALPVVEDGRLVGLVTSLDLLKAFRFTRESLFPPYEQIMTRPVREIMRENVETVAPRTPLPRALERMVRTRNKSLPVTEGNKLVGILTRDDVMRALRRAVAGEKRDAPV
ncbi:MAG TPA: CBS domain-containing protein [Myxococcota bacterium]|nr:CBS domain-containing protein [Myxococcota bacterium]